MLQVLDVQENAREFLAETAGALGASSGAVYVHVGGAAVCVASLGGAAEATAVQIPMRVNDEVVGYLTLGPPRDRAGYADADLRTVQSSADLVGRAIALSRSTSNVFQPVREEARLAGEDSSMPVAGA